MPQTPQLYHATHSDCALHNNSQLIIIHCTQRAPLLMFATAPQNFLDSPAYSIYDHFKNMQRASYIFHILVRLKLLILLACVLCSVNFSVLEYCIMFSSHTVQILSLQNSTTCITSHVYDCIIKSKRDLSLQYVCSKEEDKITYQHDHCV